MILLRAAAGPVGELEGPAQLLQPAAAEGKPNT